MNKLFNDLKEMNSDKLHATLLDHKKNLMNLKFQLSSGNQEKTHGVRVSRRSVARIKTLITQRAHEEKKNA